MKLIIGAPLTEGVAYTLTVDGIRDITARGNEIERVTKTFTAENLLYALPAADLFNGEIRKTASGLPVQKNAPWSMSMLVKSTVKPADKITIAGFGPDRDKESGGARYIALFPDGIRFWSANEYVVSNSPFDPGRWQMLTATSDGKTLVLYKDGQPMMKKDIQFRVDSDTSISIGAIDPWDHKRRFEGSIRDFSIRRGAMTNRAVKKLFDKNAVPQ